jgi:hypothetical protein
MPGGERKEGLLFEKRSKNFLHVWIRCGAAGRLIKQKFLVLF